MTAPVDIGSEEIERAAAHLDAWFGLKGDAGIKGASDRLRALHAALAASKKLLRDADTVIEDWAGLLKESGCRSSIIDGDVVRDTIRAFLEGKT
jgi:hypothetical protein